MEFETITSESVFQGKILDVYTDMRQCERSFGTAGPPRWYR